MFVEPKRCDASVGAADTTRRTLLRAVLWSGLAGVSSAYASPRPARGGKLALRVPFTWRSFDPHALDDLGAMLFGGALFESLYRLGPGGAGFEPVLAESLPTAKDGILTVPLRKGLISGRGRVLTPRHVADSIERSRRGAGRFVLHGIPSAKVGPQSLEFSFKDEARLTLALSSPLVAFAGPSFAPTAPDGTGSFVADGRDDLWTFRRNLRAASGVPLLDSLHVRRATSLSDSLRAFEAGDDQLGFHGLGLHDTRPGARGFDAGAAGVLALAVGKDAGPLDVPGVAQQLCDGLSPQRFAHLNLGPAWTVGAAAGWTGAPAQLLVVDDSPYLRELAETVAVALSRPGHEVAARPTPAAELRDRVRARNHALALAAYRPLWPTPLGTYGALLAASDPEHAAATLSRPPKVQSVRSLARSLRVGLLGELRWQGGIVGDLQLPAADHGGIDWGNVYYARKKK